MSANAPTPAADVTHAGGLRAKRLFPTDRQSHLDPFVVFERFFIEPTQGFETHPHSGFEIVSYMLEGGMAHRPPDGRLLSRRRDQRRVDLDRPIGMGRLPVRRVG